MPDLPRPAFSVGPLLLALVCARPGRTQLRRKPVRGGGKGDAR